MENSISLYREANFQDKEDYASTKLGAKEPIGLKTNLLKNILVGTSVVTSLAVISPLERTEVQERWSLSSFFWTSQRIQEQKDIMSEDEHKMAMKTLEELWAACPKGGPTDVSVNHDKYL